MFSEKCLLISKTFIIGVTNPPFDSAIILYFRIVDKCQSYKTIKTPRGFYVNEENRKLICK